MIIKLLKKEMKILPQDKNKNYKNFKKIKIDNLNNQKIEILINSTK